MTEVFDVQQGITGELREKLAEYEPQETSDEFRTRPVGAIGYDIMMALCDSIDAVHANLERENAELKAELDRVLGEQEEHAHTRVELPKDANGEHIQPSDIPYLTNANDGKRFAYCPPLSLRQDGTWVIAGWPPDRYRISKPTVEDVLREFADGIKDQNEDFTDLAIAEYSKRLALAGGAK